VDKETLSNYGWVVICVLVLVVMIALAGPFGRFISQAIKSTSDGLADVNNQALGSVNIDANIGKFDGIDSVNMDAGTYDANGNLLHTWDSLINEGKIKVNGEKLIYIDYTMEAHKLIVSENITSCGGIDGEYMYGDGTIGTSPIKTIVFKNGLKTVSAESFYYVYDVFIVFPNSVTKFEENAFYETMSLISYKGNIYDLTNENQNWTNEWIKFNELEEVEENASCFE
jgi:hypothetical protein